MSGEGLVTSQRPPAMFLADAVALDFLNSVATPVDTPFDWIRDGEGLVDWLEQAALVPPDVLKTLRDQALPGELDSVAAQARSHTRGHARRWCSMAICGNRAKHSAHRERMKTAQRRA